MSTSAAHHLSPAFPERAAWGTAPKLRAWQEGALAAYLERSAAGEKDFLTVATPGAGKTTYALQVATELLDRGLIREVTVVAPTEHLKHQWADAAARVGIHLNPAFANSVAVQSHEYGGVALTYAQVASRPDLHRQRTLARPTLVILDEIHHGGDAKSWGDAIREAFEPATRRLSLTGTPFRSDTSPIPFVRYEMDEQGILRSAADHSYGYAEALRDGVVRPVLFLAYGGAMRWRTKAGDEVAARLGEPMTKDAAAQAWRTALDPKGEWIPSVLRAADKRLTEVRRHVPDAGAMVIASNQTAARAYARHLETITGEKPTVVLSDDSGASTRIEEYAAGTSRWLVAVRMVSEGVDVPRLCVGVYATSTSTPLFFAQAVGRFVRARKRGETASVFLPSVPIILDKGAQHYADYGMGRSRGTLPFQLAGNVKRGGLVEKAFGLTLNELLYDYGGGSASGRPIRAVQIGGPLGPYLPASKFDLPLDYEAYAAVGAVVGHGGVVVHDDTADMARLARYAMEFCALESCGKCTPCRIGSTRGVEVIDRIAANRNRPQQVHLLRDLCDTMLHGSLCAMGGMTPYPVLSALNHYPQDFGITVPDTKAA